VRAVVQSSQTFNRVVFSIYKMKRCTKIEHLKRIHKFKFMPQGRKLIARPIFCNKNSLIRVGRRFRISNPIAKMLIPKGAPFQQQRYPEYI
jgi:hypothetical protein